MELRELSGNKRKRKKEKGKNERAFWKVEVWEKGEDVDKIVYTCVVDKIQEKKKKKKGKGKVWWKKKKEKY